MFILGVIGIFLVISFNEMKISLKNSAHLFVAPIIFYLYEMNIMIDNLSKKTTLQSFDN